MPEGNNTQQFIEQTDYTESATDGTMLIDGAPKQVVKQDKQYQKHLETVAQLKRDTQINISFAEHIDPSDSEDKYRIIVESKAIPGLIKSYNFKSIKNMPTDFIGRGHKLSPVKVSHLLDELTNYMPKYVGSRFHTQIGWSTFNNEPIFKYNDVAIKDDSIHSKYQGKLELKSSGSLDEYINGIRSLVVPYSKLLLIYLAGASGMITQALQLPDTNIVMNICGDTSCGKTTAEDVALSFWGKYNSQEFNTDNRVEQILAERFIIPVSVDDILAQNAFSTLRTQQKTISNQIFRYSTGKMKGRFNQESAIYFGGILMSSEVSILQKIVGSEASGQFYRLIELFVKRGELTKDAEHTQALRNLIQKNYGLGAYALGKFMVENNFTQENLHAMYEEQRAELEGDIRLIHHARAANRLAILTLTGILLDKCFNLGIDIQKVKDTLIESVTRALEGVDLNKKAYKDIYQVIIHNPEKFAQSKKAYDGSKHVGVYKQNEYGNNELIIPTDKIAPLMQGVPVDQIISGSGTAKVSQSPTSSIQGILKTWRDHGWLSCNVATGQMYRKLTLGDCKKQSLVYVVTFQSEAQDGIEMVGGCDA